MLSRTAANLYWIARYVARAETNARLLAVASRNALLPETGGGYRNEWDSVLLASGTKNAFDVKFGVAVERNVETHLFFDRDNPSSIASCLHAARENGRIVRTALTMEVWDALNTAHRDLQDMARQERSSLSTTDLVDWTIRTTALIRGTQLSTQLRNDGFDFTNVGHFLECADSTARILDVKYYVLLPGPSFVGSGIDNYQWRTLLRALSSARAFNWVYGGDVTAGKIVDFLIFNNKAPRSLVSSVEGVQSHLDRLSRQYGGVTDAQARAGALGARLAGMGVEDVFDHGLHEFLGDFIRDVSALGSTVEMSYFDGGT